MFNVLLIICFIISCTYANTDLNLESFCSQLCGFSIACSEACQSGKECGTSGCQALSWCQRGCNLRDALLAEDPRGVCNQGWTCTDGFQDYQFCGIITISSYAVAFISYHVVRKFFGFKPRGLQQSLYL